MENLIFSSATSQSGFTNASISASNDKNASVIIRELIQNSYDSALEEANESTVKVKLIIDYIDKEEIPSIKSYEKAIKAIKKDPKLSEQEQDILNVIHEELEKTKIPVLHIIDNGIGFNQQKLVAVLSDGISDKSDPNNASGSYGNGHFSAFSASNLRYVIYGGKTKDGLLCSGQALLRTHKESKKLKSATGFLRTKDKAIIQENNIFLKNYDIPPIMLSQLNKIKKYGAIVSILGFNFFGDEENIDKVASLISSSIIRNFFIAIKEEHLEVEVIHKNQHTIINNENFEAIFYQTENEKTEPSFKTVKRFYELVAKGKSDLIKTSEGDVKLYHNLSDNNTKLALCRNGMWINDSIPSPMNLAQFIENKKFNALILPQKNSSISVLIRRAEGNLHRDIRLNRFSSDKDGQKKREKLQQALAEIRNHLLDVIEKNNNDSFDVDIPELSVHMVGKSSSNLPNERKSKKTKKMKKRVKAVDNSNEPLDDKIANPKKDKSKTKRRVGNRFNVAKFTAIHNTQSKQAKVRFNIDKQSNNLLLSLRLDDGKDPTCDGYGTTTSERLTILSATNQNQQYDIIHNDTINIGEVAKGEAINLTIEYQSDIKGDYTIDYEFLNSMPIEKDKK